MQTRRDLCLSLSFLALANSLRGQTTSGTAPTLITDMSHGMVLPCGNAVLNTNAHGAGLEIMKSTLPNGTRCTMHVTELSPGQSPHPPHQHKHMEFMFVREGILDWMVNDQHFTAGVGDVLYAAPMDLHGLVNKGTTTARYTVFEVDLQD